MNRSETLRETVDFLAYLKKEDLAALHEIVVELANEEAEKILEHPASRQILGELALEQAECE